MSRSLSWTLIFICREKGYSQDVAKKAINCFLEIGARYNYVGDLPGHSNYREKQGDKFYKAQVEKERGDPDSSKLAKAIEICTRTPGGGIQFDFPVKLGISCEEDKSNWTEVHLEFRPGWDEALDQLKVDNFVFAADFFTYLTAQAIPEREDERWHSQARVRLPRLVEVCEHVYKRMRPYMAVIIPALEIFNGKLPHLATFNIFSPELVEKIGREKITNCPWYKCETLEDGALDCWDNQYLLYAPTITYTNEGLECFKYLENLPIFEIAGNL